MKQRNNFWEILWRHETSADFRENICFRKKISSNKKFNVLAKNSNISTTIFADKGGVRWFTRKRKINDFSPLNFVERKTYPEKFRQYWRNFAFSRTWKMYFRFNPTQKAFLERLIKVTAGSYVDSEFIDQNKNGWNFTHLKSMVPSRSMSFQFKSAQSRLWQISVQKVFSSLF